MTLIVIAAAVWSLCGVFVAALLARHGHNFWLFALLGFAYGPLLVLIWLLGARDLATESVSLEPVSRQVDSDDAGTENDGTGGWIDVLVGLDGTDDAVQSTKHVLDTLGPAIGRLRLISVLDHEVISWPDAFSSDERRINYLEQASNVLSNGKAEISLASGQPDLALNDHAAENDFDLLIVAHRHSALGSGLRGSTVARLARNADLPVLIGPPTA